MFLVRHSVRINGCLGSKSFLDHARSAGIVPALLFAVIGINTAPSPVLAAPSDAFALGLFGSGPARALVSKADLEAAPKEMVEEGATLSVDEPDVLPDRLAGNDRSRGESNDVKSGMDATEHMVVEGIQTRFEKTLMESIELDAFFSDPERHEEELQVTRLRVRGDGFLREGSGTDFDVNVRGRYAFPQTNNRVVLLLSGDFDRALGPEDNPQQSDIKSLLEPDDEEEDGVLAIQGFLTATRKLNVSIQAGGRLRGGDPVAFIGPRYRQTFDLGKWNSRLLVQTRWFTDEGFSVRGIVDFERILNERFFLRLTPRIDWSEENDPLFYRFDFDLTQRLNNDQRIRYQFFTAAQTELSGVVSQLTFRVNYRRRFIWDWLFVEVAPELTFLEARDFEPTPGVFVRFDAILGPFGVRMPRPLRRVLGSSYPDSN